MKDSKINMIINNMEFTENDIVSIKLVTQEEIVGKIVSFTGDVIILDKPMVLSATQQGFHFIPFMITGSREFKTVINFYREHLLCDPVFTENEIKSNYIETTTGFHLVK